MQALQKRLQPTRYRRPTNMAQITMRRTELRRLYSMGYTNGQICGMLNDYLEENGMTTISQRTFDTDLCAVLRDFHEVVADDVQTKAQEIDAHLQLLLQKQNEDYEKARSGDKKPSPLYSDNVRKTIVERGKLAGVFVEKHQHDGKMTVEHHLKEILSIKPETLEVLDLLPDEDYVITPIPKIAADG